MKPIVNFAIVHEAMHALLGRGGEGSADDVFERQCAAQLLHAVFAENRGEPFGAIQTVRRLEAEPFTLQEVLDAGAFVDAMIIMLESTIDQVLESGPPTSGEAARVLFLGDQLRRGRSVRHRLFRERSYTRNAIDGRHAEMRLAVRLTMPDGHEQSFYAVQQFTDAVMRYAGSGLGGLLRSSARSLLYMTEKNVCDWVDGGSGT